MKRIIIINTGGTFSSGQGENGLAPKKEIQEIRDFKEKLADTMTIVLEDYCSLDSANIRPADWSRLSEKIEKAVGEYDGVVVIHGTDTMSYTASMLSFMLAHIPIPVVITGSQLPIGAPMSDAEGNLRCAVEMAGSGVCGVFLVFNQKIILGCRSSKVRTVSFQAFESINYPYVGEFNAFGMQLQKQDIFSKGDFAPKTTYSDKIAVLKLFPGMCSDIFAFLRKRGYEGIYVEGFGLGGVPYIESHLMEEMERTSNAGIPVLVGSQCCYEGSNLNIYETGKRVLSSGGIPVYDMTSEAVVTKLMWCLGQNRDIEKIKEAFSTNYVDEVTLP